jgi:hypothetical protein
MSLKKIDKKNYHVKEFYNLFSKKENQFEIEKLLSSEIDSELLVYGFLSAVKHNQQDYINTLLTNIKINTFNNKNKYIETSNIKLIFNCAIEYENIDLINALNDQFAIIDTLKEYRYVRVDEKGKLENTGFLPAGKNLLEKFKEDYIGNPFLFGLSNSKLEMVEFLLQKCKDIHPSVVENAFVESCDIMNETAVLYLTENKQTRKIINESKIISLFLNEEIQLYEIKQKAKASLAMMNLKDELGGNTAKDKSKLKM